MQSTFNSKWVWQFYKVAARSHFFFPRVRFRGPLSGGFCGANNMRTARMARKVTSRLAPRVRFLLHLFFGSCVEFPRESHIAWVYWISIASTHVARPFFEESLQLGNCNFENATFALQKIDLSSSICVHACVYITLTQLKRHHILLSWVIFFLDYNTTLFLIRLKERRKYTFLIYLYLNLYIAAVLSVSLRLRIVIIHVSIFSGYISCAPFPPPQ